MSRKQAQRIARQIALDLFTSGVNGEEAHWLTLIDKDGRDMGGWSKTAVIDRIAEKLVGVK